MNLFPNKSLLKVLNGTPLPWSLSSLLQLDYWTGFDYALACHLSISNADAGVLESMVENAEYVYWRLVRFQSFNREGNP